jgi:hypothetical protein
MAIPLQVSENGSDFVSNDTISDDTIKDYNPGTPAF